MMCVKNFFTLIVLFMFSLVSYANEPVKYINGEGKECYVEKYRVVTSEDTVLTSGWYVVRDEVSLNVLKHVELRGKVNLLLTDDCLLSISSMDVGMEGYVFFSTLNIYSQSLGEHMGRLKICLGLSDREAISTTYLNLYGGNIDIVGEGIIGFYTSEATVYAGNVNFGNSAIGFYAHDVKLCGGYLTINPDDSPYGGMLIQCWHCLTIDYSYADLDVDSCRISVCELVISDGITIVLDGMEYSGTYSDNFFSSGVIATVSVDALAKNDDDNADEVLDVRNIVVSEGKTFSGWYTLGGVRLTDKPTASGIYIHDGRKVVVK